MKSNISHQPLMAGLILSFLLTLSVRAEAGGSENLKKEIEAANAEFVARFAASDGAGIAALYTEGGQLLPPNGEPISDHAAIGAFWQGAMDSGVMGAKLETVEVEGMGKTAVEVGRFALNDAEGNVLVHGKYVVIWKQVDGQWKLHRDIWNSSVPPPAADTDAEQG